MKRKVFAVVIGFLTIAIVTTAQSGRPLSPDGIASVHVLGKWVKTNGDNFTMGNERYVGGKWIDITYGRPLLRGRDAFTGTGADYGKATYAGAPVWRAGANVSTRLKTEVPLVIGDKRIPAGEYSLFIELNQPTRWTFIVSNWGALPRFGSSTKDALFGAFDYTADKDVTRATMKVEALPYKAEQLTWMFIDTTDSSGRMAVMWDKTIASVPFTVGSE